MSGQWRAQRSETDLRDRSDQASRLWSIGLALEELGYFEQAEEELKETIEAYRFIYVDEEPLGNYHD